MRNIKRLMFLTLPALFIAGCSSNSSNNDDNTTNTVKLSGVVYAPSGTTLSKATFIDNLMNGLFGHKAMAVLSGADAVSSGISVNLVDTTKTGADAVVASGTTDSNGGYSIDAPEGFVANPKYVVRAGTDTTYIEARVTDTSVNVDPISHVTSQLVTDMTSDSATNLAKLNTDEILAIANEVELLLPETDTDYSAETSLSAITTGLKNAALSNEETASILYNTTSSGKICGTVTNANGVALADVVVLARDYNEWVTRAKIKTDSTGAYCLNLPVAGETINNETHNGKYILGVNSRVGDVSSNFWASEWWTADGGASSIWNGALVELTSSSATTTKNFELELGGRIRGVITDANQTAVEGVTVLVRDFDTWYPVAATRTNSEGKYKLNLRAGNYIVLARNHTRTNGASEIFSDAGSDLTSDHTNLFGHGDKITVAPESDKVAKFELQSGVLVHGSVLTDTGGAPVSGIRVRFDRNGQYGALAAALRTNKDGKYRIWLKKDDYEVRSRGQLAQNIDLTVTNSSYTLDFTNAVSHATTQIMHSSSAVAQALAFLWRMDNATTGDMTLVSQEVSSSDGSVDLYIEDTTAQHILEVKLKEGSSGAASIIYSDQGSDSNAYATRRLDGTNISVVGDVPASINLPDGYKLSGIVSNTAGDPLGVMRVIVRQTGLGKTAVFTADMTGSDGEYSVYLPAATYSQLMACDPAACTAGGTIQSVTSVAISNADVTQDFTLNVQ